MISAKYRGMSTKGEWVHGSLVIAEAHLKHKQAQHTRTWIVTSAFGNGGWFNIRGRCYVKPDTVGQFTGLQDKNGVDIYEGDIIKGSSEWFDIVTGEVKMSGYDDCEEYMNKRHFGWNVNGIPLFDLVHDGLTVIGNTHENKELLK